ncbi:hypothetical protein MASR2M78_04180 [Treponema sp.]
MEVLRDLSWMAQLSRGPLERFELRGYSVSAVSGNRSSSGGTYQYRLLFFETGEHRPFYAVSLESSILGALTISEQRGDKHRILERLDSQLNYEQFRIKALEHALSNIDIK